METTLQQNKKYEIIAEQIKEQIIREGLRKNDRLPSVIGLSKMFNVAPATICESLKLLRKAKIIRSVPKKGSFIARLPNLPKKPKSKSQTTFEDPNSSLDFLEHNSPLKTVFTSTATELTFYTNEFEDVSRKKMWEKLLNTVESGMVNTRIKPVYESESFKYIRQSGLPDVFTIYEPNLRFFRQAGLLQTIPENEIYETFMVSEHFKLSWRKLLSDKRVDCIPFSISVALSLWNTNLYATYCPDKNISDQKCRKISTLKETIDFDAENAPIVASFIHMLFYTLLEEGIKFYNPETNRLSLKNPAIREVLKFNKMMFGKFCQRFNVSTIHPSLVWESFFRGEILSMNTFSYALPMFSKEVPFGSMVFPGQQMYKKYSPSTSIYLGISKGCRDSERARDFIRLASGPLGQTILSEFRANVPVYKKIAMSPEFLSGCPSGMDKVVSELENTTMIFNNWPIFDYTFQDKILGLTMQFFEGRIDLDTAMKMLQKTASLLTGNIKNNS